MNPSDASEFEIGRCPDQRREDALRLVMAHLGADQREAHLAVVLAAARRDPTLFAGLVEARAGERLLGAAWIQPEIGRTAIVWPPRLASHVGEKVAHGLITAALEAVAHLPIVLFQALLRTDAGDDARRLQAYGFQLLADLLYLVSVSGTFPMQRPPSALAYEPYSIANHSRFAKVAAETYENSRDCPRLDGLRDVEDVLAGYRATGEFDPHRWLLVRHHGQDVGCLLLADHAAERQWELVYMGIVPRFRGHGWGTEVVRHAQWLTRAASRKRLVLAVDAANEPAITAYAAAGFSAWDRRTVYIRKANSVARAPE